MIKANLENKTALVTGAASGIGFATAEMLAANGAKVALNDLPNNQRLEDAVNTLRANGFDVIAAPGDTGNEQSTNAMVEHAIDELGGLDYLVNNAGTPGTQHGIAPAQPLLRLESIKVRSLIPLQPLVL